MMDAPRPVDESSAFSVVALTVTYGDRRHLLRQVLQRLDGIEPALQALVIVFNGVDYDPVAFVDELNLGLAVRIERLPCNEGSAVGFGRGLALAAEVSGANWIWMVDDDNMPRPDALAVLKAAWQSLGGQSRVLLLSLRSNRWDYLVAAQNGVHRGYVDNAFFDFSVGAALMRRWRRWKPFDPTDPRFPQFPIVRVGYAPYGGLLMHRDWLARVGLPNPGFFLYEDDFDYTDRMVRAGGDIFLCAQSVIDDLEQPWSLDQDGRCHFLLDHRSPVRRVFLTVRNRSFIESKSHVSNRLVYFVNTIAFLARIVLVSYRAWLDPRLWLRLRLVILALRCGWQQDLEPMNGSLLTRLGKFE